MISEHPISTGFHGLTGFQWDPLDRGVTSSLITGDLNSGHITLQQEALLHLEQMQIKDWKYIKELCQTYYHFCAILGNGFNQEL